MRLQKVRFKYDLCKYCFVEQLSDGVSDVELLADCITILFSSRTVPQNVGRKRCRIIHFYLCATILACEEVQSAALDRRGPTADRVVQRYEDM